MGTKPTGTTKRDWRSEIVDLEVNLEEARTLARIMYQVLAQQPTSMDEYHESLASENLPRWIRTR